MGSFARRCVAEAIGTFVLVFIGAGSVMTTYFPRSDYGVLGIAMAYGLALAVMMTATLNISGGHLNPAVTLGLLASRRITLSVAGGHVVAQLFGAVLAAFILKGLYPAAVLRAATSGVPHLAPSVSLTQGLVVETVLGFVLVSAYYGTHLNQDTPRFGGFGVGLALLFCVLVGGPLTGGAVNPARAFGPALVAGEWVAHVVWWVGPIAGGVLAALVWDYGLMRRPAEGGKA